MDAPSDQALEQLAELCGIVPGYRDVQGIPRWTAQETRRALLQAMGIDVASDAAVQAAIREQQERPWRQVLPPVRVVGGCMGTTEVALSIPERLATVDWSFTIRLEDGTERRGTVQPTQLEPLESRRIDDEQVVRYRWRLADLPEGYHSLGMAAGETSAETTLIAAPERCYTPSALADDGRVWGPALQLFALRSHRNWGIGDFTDLEAGLEVFADAGAGTVGLGPLHSLYPHQPDHVSPYSPSSRLFWNVLYIDVEALPGMDDCAPVQARLGDPEFRARIAEARDQELVDYVAVSALKREILELAFAHFRDRQLADGTGLGHEFASFRSRAGRALEQHALFEALAEHFGSDGDDVWGPAAWPPGYEHPDAPAARDFAAAHAVRIEFFMWLQWLAELQLGTAAARAAELRLGVGLYLDLPLGADGGGSEVWAGGEVFAHGVSVGAPPDDFNHRGQDWGLLPWIPERLTAAAYRPFIELLRRNMRHAGALRLDHVMALMRLFWIPAGAKPAEGAYVSYPLDDLLAILALESQRQRCAVIGEDLGTVPDRLRERLAPLGVLSNRVLFFEKDAEGQVPAPKDFPPAALVSVSNHDLPTLRGYWRGEDIGLRQRLDLYPDDGDRERAVVERARDRARLLFALHREGLLPERIDQDPLRVPDMPVALMVAVHRYLARSPSRLLTFQLEDAFGVVAQVNLPGTTAEYPNWRYRLPVALERFPEDPRLGALLDGLREERGVSAMREPGPRRSLVIPGATYRLQVNGDFTFADVGKLVPYLSRLGVSHCYLSPFLKARPGSSHGYDLIDHTSLNPEIGSREDLASLAATLQAAGMGIVADMVPNHMGVMGSDNTWWLDVLENGEASQYAEYFDIDWQPVRSELRDKVLIPILGDHYGSILEGGELKLAFDAEHGSFAVHYHEHALPLDPISYARILALDLEVLAGRLGSDDVDYAEYESLIRAFEQLPARNDPDAERRETRLREKEVAKRRLAALCRRCPTIQEQVDTNVVRLSGLAGEPESFATLHELLESQAWRLAHWQVAADEINYRRFFDINDLAALRIEHADLLEQTHALMAGLYQDGLVDGLRIDHPDGLYDPAGYFRDLQALLSHAEPDQDCVDADAGCYVVAEKILAPHEHLPEDWPVHGTTGYDFSLLVNGLTVYPGAEEALTRCYVDFTGADPDFDEILYESKKLVIRVHLSSELTMLANLANRIAQADWHTRDFTLNGIRDVLAEIVAAFPVYRTYVTPRKVSAEDRNYIDWALANARRRDPETNPDLYEFIRRRLLLDFEGELSAHYRALCERFAMKFQQYTAPVMAKALEDTSFYRYARLLSLCEVGGDPRRFGISVAAFHHHNEARLRHWPHAMLAGSTHDNKRSEDVRTRLNVLSEVADEWSQRVQRWRQLNRFLRRDESDEGAPTAHDEYLYYQSLVGIWPLDAPGPTELESLAERLSAYMRKAVREAKVNSGWMHPGVDYEAALERFVRFSLEPSGSLSFLDDVDAFVARLSRFGILNSLASVALRLTVPGVPDLYQGDELWSFNLVDPDNRRPVDFQCRDAILSALEAQQSATEGSGPLFPSLLDEPADGRAKLYLTWRLLRLRDDHPELFTSGDYLPLTVVGERSEHVCAFARRHGDHTVVVVTGRWFARLQDGGDGFLPRPELWQDTRVELPEGCGRLHDVLGGAVVDGGSGVLRVADVLAPQPVAVLVSDRA